jgi:hypothetical protein
MRRSGRILPIALSALGVLALGFVVAMAANSVPGRGAEEPFLDGAWRPAIDVTTVMTWLVLIAAVMGVVIFALSVKETRPPRDQERRGVVLVLILGVIVFALVARYMRSIADTFLPAAPDVISEAGEEPIADTDGNGAWLLSLLVATVIAVALARVGLAIRSGAPPVLGQKDDLPSPVAVVAPAPLPPKLGSDPRSRILGAYDDFEQRVGEAGLPREPAETAARHAGRAKAALGLAAEDLSVLLARFADARFGPAEPSVDDADEAESAATRLRQRIRG